MAGTASLLSKRLRLATRYGTQTVPTRNWRHTIGLAAVFAFSSTLAAAGRALRKSAPYGSWRSVHSAGTRVDIGRRGVAASWNVCAIGAPRSGQHALMRSTLHRRQSSRPTTRALMIPRSTLSNSSSASARRTRKGLKMRIGTTFRTQLQLVASRPCGVLLTSWNARSLISKRRASRARNIEWLHELLRNSDVVAVQDVRGNEMVADVLFRILGPSACVLRCNASQQRWVTTHLRSYRCMSARGIFSYRSLHRGRIG